MSIHFYANNTTTETREREREKEMSSPSSQFAAPSGAIVGPCFCVPDPIGLTFFIDAAWLNCDHLAVTDINGNVVFKVEAHKWSLRNRQVVVDASGKPVISMQQKLRSIHDRWQVFKGNSSDPKHLLFSVKRSSALQFKTELDVFLAANTKEEVCDFKIKGSFRKRSFTVYKGDSSMVIAQMSKEDILVNGLVSKDAFEVAVNPNTDYSFITALTIIRHEFFKEDAGISDEISDEISNEISDEISNEISDEISNEISDEISNEISNQIANEISDEISDENSDETSDAISDENSDETSDGISSVIISAISALLGGS
ncbi:protein LURP-one-related 15-like [Musa acuminata AAA Group]|uniref:protein LURP-one-related 15-like n=1 Tax=Musa acuminata AAA Group TaxID=214697 RepID=UPI0031DD3B08